MSGDTVANAADDIGLNIEEDSTVEEVSSDVETLQREVRVSRAIVKYMSAKLQQIVEASKFPVAADLDAVKADIEAGQYPGVSPLALAVTKKLAEIHAASTPNPLEILLLQLNAANPGADIQVTVVNSAEEADALVAKLAEEGYTELPSEENEAEDGIKTSDEE